MPTSSASSKPALQTWRLLRKAPHDLTDLEISEISLVDAPANRYATVVIKKSADGGGDTYRRVVRNGVALYERAAKQSGAGGPAEAALPRYESNRDPQYDSVSRPRKESNMSITTNPSKRARKRKRLASMVESIAKGEANAFETAMQSATSDLSYAEQVVLVRKQAERLARPPGGALDQRTVEKVEAGLWRDLYAKGQIAPDNLEKRIQKQENLIARYDQASALPLTKTEAKIEALAVEIAKAEGDSLDLARAKAWLRNGHLYSAYLEEFNQPAHQERIAKARRFKDDPGTNSMDAACGMDGDDDEECDDDEEDDGAEKRRKAKKAKTKCACGKVSKASKLFCSNCGRRK
jgi:hypothetical protein